MSAIGKFLRGAEQIEVTKIVVRSDGALRCNLYLRDGTLILGSNEINGEIVSVGFEDIIHIVMRVGDGTKEDPARLARGFFGLDGHFIAELS